MSKFERVFVGDESGNIEEKKHEVTGPSAKFIVDESGNAQIKKSPKETRKEIEAEATQITKDWKSKIEDITGQNLENQGKK